MKQSSSDRVDSESSDSESEEEKRISSFPRSRQERVCKTKTYLLVVLFFAVVMFELYWFLHTKTHQSKAKAHNLSHQDSQNHKEAIIQQSSKNGAAKYQPQSEMKFLILPSLSSTKQFGNSNFIQEDLRKGDMSWFDYKEIACEPDKIVNSASKIQQYLFLQKTAYSKVNILYRKVTIPAENLYRLEGPHQLIRNFSKKDDIVIAFAHSDPLLLVIAATYSSKGLFVSNSSDWPLMKSNLIINDLFPFAKPTSLASVISSKGYNFLITDNYSLIEQLLLLQRREIVIMMEISEPTEQQTAVLLKLKVYRLEAGQQCEGRVLSLYEQSSWHVSQSAILLPSWYVFTIQSIPLPLQFEKKEYQTALFKPQSIKCINQQNYQPTSMPFNNEYILQSVSYEGIRLLRRKKNPLQVDHYREIFAYLQNYPPSNLFLHSGSFYLALLAMSTLKKDSKVSVGPFYDLPLLMKNLVLNNLQVDLQQQFEKQTDLLVITANLQEVIDMNASKIILTSTKPVVALRGYSIRRFKESEQCNSVELLLGSQSALDAGNYLFVKDNG